jgi:anti-anti-sigma factor
VAAGETKIIFDFSKTDYISSAGLRVILQAAKLVHKDGKIAICNTNEQVHEVLEISGFLDMIDHFSNLQKAMAAISK